VLTHSAALDGRSSVPLATADGRMLDARVAAYELSTGLALLQTEPSTRPSLPLAPDAPAAGTLAVAVGFLALFGLGWGFFDCNNMPILAQLVRPELRATGYGIMNLVSISCGGFADWGFGAMRDAKIPLNVIFGAFAGTALISVVLVLLIRPREKSNQ
jgi:hypothetical protein